MIELRTLSTHGLTILVEPRRAPYNYAAVNLKGHISIDCDIGILCVSISKGHVT
jgi:hypothetical protein